MTMTGQEPFFFSDLALARRLERTEARSNAEFVEARAKAFPASGAQWIEAAGAYAMFDGPASPLTQSFGLGLFQSVTSAELDVMEEFFRERGAEVFHEICPLADSTLLPLLNERGYQPIEFTSVLYRQLRSDLHLARASTKRINVRLIYDGEQELWAQTSAAGWGEYKELAAFMLEIGHIISRRETAPLFLAEVDGCAVGTGALDICDGVALLAGASTIPEGRRQGAQAALLESRLRYAAERGCDIAMMGARPGSASQRNAERNGFRIAYTRIKWQLPRR